MPDLLTITTSPRQKSAPCPTCGEPSQRVHSRYLRQLHDLPWQGRPVTIKVQARRFRCANSSCPRRTFAEHLHESPAARHAGPSGWVSCSVTWRLATWRRGRRPAGRPARHADQPGHPAAARPRAAIPRPIPRVLGVDDWAWRQGHATAPSWSTWSADGRRPAARPQAETLAAWLRQHPGVRARRPRPRRRLCRGRRAGRPGRYPGRGPLAPAAQPRRGAPSGGRPAPCCRPACREAGHQRARHCRPGGDGRSAGQAYRGRDPPPRGA